MKKYWKKEMRQELKIKLDGWQLEIIRQAKENLKTGTVSEGDLATIGDIILENYGKK